MATVHPLPSFVVGVVMWLSPSRLTRAHLDVVGSVLPRSPPAISRMPFLVAFIVKDMAPRPRTGINLEPGKIANRAAAKEWGNNSLRMLSLLVCARKQKC